MKDTLVTLIRHAQPDFSVKDDRTRPLTEAGRRDSQRVVQALAGQAIDHIYSSPFLRTLDTVRPLAAERGLAIGTVEDFRERKVADGWIQDFRAYAERQWRDFDYRLEGGESLGEAQRRNVAALERLLDAHPGEHLAVGTHGTALSTLLNHYDPGFGFDAFWSIVDRMPWLVRLRFQGRTYLGREEIGLD